MILFGTIVFLFATAIGIVAGLAVTQGDARMGGRILLTLCSIPILFILLSGLVGGLAFRRFGRPMAQVFDAIDSITEGDLTVRIPEDHPREYGRFARKFNHMVGELERAETRRRNLTADVAHELRTPLHIIQGNLEGILDGVYQPTAEHIAGTLEETRLLSRLVGDLQTLSLAESGQLPLNLTRFAVRDLFDDLAASFASSLSAGGLSFECSAADPTLEVVADYDRMNQILTNLVSNALRHTPAGGRIRVEARAEGSGIQMRVEDSGSGIPAEELPFIFDRFWRGDRSRMREVDSHSGLGLAIVRQLVQAHGGTIEVESRAGEGTQFVINLPG